jgi:hypothetical protein
MIAIETNILVYSHRREVPEHDAALDTLAEVAGSSEPWAIPWPCVYEFYSVVTNRRIWGDAASSPAEAWAQIEAWTGSPSAVLLSETSRDFVPILERFVMRPRVVGPVVHDARIAALCLAHGVDRLLTRDRDFSLFPELLTEDPLD